MRRTVLFTVVAGVATLGFGLGSGVSGAVAPMSATAAAAASHPPRLTKMVAEAIHQTTLHISYSYGGGHGPRPAPLNSHVDCSGFVREMYGYAFGIDIGSGSGDSMVRLSGKFVKTSHPVPGDVVLLGHGGRAPAYHSGIYIGMIGGHPAMVASPQTGSNIKIQQWYNRSGRADLMGYWHFKGATAADSHPLVRPKTDGRFDTATGTHGGIRLTGWVLDPQRPAGAGSVAVTIDNRLVAALPANILRADVNRVKRVTGNHGFAASITFPRGRHIVCVTARPAGTSSAGANLGCKAVTVPR